jgi:hypothetical protein
LNTLLTHIQFKSKHILADATYKLIDEGFPVLTIGTTDRDKHFHPFGLAVCTNEDEHDFFYMFDSLKKAAERIAKLDMEPHTLVADNAASITNGYTRVFGKPKYRVNCWAHVIRRITEHLVKIDQQTVNEIYQDITDIQLLAFVELAEEAFRLFDEKWRSTGNPQVITFLNYFKKEWTANGRNGWYEGYSEPGIPSQSNAIESIHMHIKVTNDRTTKPLSEFMTSACRQHGFLFEWSKIRAPYYIVAGEKKEHKDQKKFITTATIGDQDILKTFQYNNTHKKSFCRFNAVYFWPTGRTKSMKLSTCQELCDRFDKPTWETLDELLEWRESFNMISINTEVWQNSDCSCKFHMKNNWCRK